MKKAVAFVLMTLLLAGAASVGLAGEVSLKPSGDGRWTILDSTGEEIGTLAKVEEGAYSVLPKGGQYLGIIRSGGDLQLTGRHPVITPAQAQLYLDLLEPIRTLK
jgi:hypothetical protein